MVRNDIVAHVINDLCFVDELFEICTVKLTVKNRPFRIMGFYRPSEQPVNEFNDKKIQLFDIVNLQNRVVF